MRHIDGVGYVDIQEDDTVTLTSKQYHDLITGLEQEKGAYNALAKDCIPISVIEDIKAEIIEYKSANEDDKWDYYHAGRTEAFDDALEIISRHINRKE